MVCLQKLNFGLLGSCLMWKSSLTFKNKGTAAMFIALLFRSQRWKHARVCLWMSVVHAHSGILFSLKEDGDPHACSNTDGLWGHYAE